MTAPQTGMYGFVRVGRLAEAVVDDRPQLGRGQLRPDPVQRRDVRRDPAPAVLPVALRARELYEHIRPGRDHRVDGCGTLRGGGRRVAAARV
jgi:hypothetical protein